MPFSDLARPEIIKTDLGRRLRDVRRQLGDPDRESFAESLGISVRSLAAYERGDNEPSSSVLGMYKEQHGINLNWLLSGGGDMFADPAKAPAMSRTINLRLMQKLARLAREVHKETGGNPHGDAITIDAADLYNDLLTLVNNIDDVEEVDATLPRLRLLFKRKLQEQSRNREEGRNTA